MTKGKFERYKPGKAPEIIRPVPNLEPFNFLPIVQLTGNKFGSWQWQNPAADAATPPASAPEQPAKASSSNLQPEGSDIGFIRGVVLRKRYI